jgi:hypothetical protein
MIQECQKFKRQLVTVLHRIAGNWQRIRDRKDAELVASSFLFDATWYRDRYAEGQTPISDPVYDYLRTGAKRGLDPGPNFSTTAYNALHFDVAQTGMNPLVHYLRHGRSERRVIFPSAFGAEVLLNDIQDQARRFSSLASSDIAAKDRFEAPITSALPRSFPADKRYRSCHSLTSDIGPVVGLKQLMLSGQVLGVLCAADTAERIVIASQVGRVLNVFLKAAFPSKAASIKFPAQEICFSEDLWTRLDASKTLDLQHLFLSSPLTLVRLTDAHFRFDGPGADEVPEGNYIRIFQFAASPDYTLDLLAEKIVVRGEPVGGTLPCPDPAQLLLVCINSDCGKLRALAVTNMRWEA